MKTAKKILCGVLVLFLLCTFGCSGCNGCKRKKKEEPPVKEGFGLYGVADTTITAGKFFNVMEGITAKTESGADITSSIIVSGELNTAKAGLYTLTYSVSHQGESESLDRRITVVSNPAVGQEPPTFIYEAQEAFNIAKGCAVMATNTSNNSAGNAVDGDESTRWECDVPSGLSIEGEYAVDFTVDLGEVLPVEGVAVIWEAAYATDYEIQLSSDGRNYSVVQTVEDYSFVGPRATQSFTFEETLSAQYVRLHLLKRATNYAYSVYELQVFGKRGTVIPEEDYPVLYQAKNAQAKDWENECEEEVVFDLGSVCSVGAMTLSWLGYLSPATFEVAYSANGGDYVAVGLVNQPYSADSYFFYEKGGDTNTHITPSARYLRVQMHALRFYAPAYRITEAAFRETPTAEKYAVAQVTASSALEGHEAALMIDGLGETYWENDHAIQPQTIDLGGVKSVGRIDLYWRGDDGGKGKYYDLQVSNDGESFTTVFRQNHGATQKQSVYYYGSARYIRVIDYQSPDSERYMLEGIEVFSQYPSGYEPRVEYDTSISFPQQQVVETENGSYITNDPTFPSARLIAYLDESLRGKPIPTNDWWQGLLMRDKGYNMFLNPLVATYKEDGLWLTNPGDGYYSGDNPGNGRQTVNVDVQDICIGYRGMRSTAEVRVTGYSDYGITAVTTDNPAVDKLTTFLSQGALYAYCLFAEPEKATISSGNFVAAYDLDGAQILSNVGASYTGDCIIVCVRTHSGYENNIEKGNAKQYEERYYVVSTPVDTQFVREENHIAVVMQKGNYMSVGALSSVTTVSATQASEQVAHGSFDRIEAAQMHKHGYAFVVGTSCTFDVDDVTNDVTTTYAAQTYTVRNGASGEAITAFMPHHYKKSSDKCSTTYVYKSVRGDIRAHVGNVYKTVDKFYGVVPTFAEPDDDGYSAQTLYNYLIMLRSINGKGEPPTKALVSGDPYWQGKNLHPMAIAALAADQIGAIDIRDYFLGNIRFILEDWFTYTPGEETDGKSAYFYYDGEWGTLYYRNSEFGAGVNLADHHFTYGYYMLAAGVLSAYQPDFAVKYKDMIELMLRDYMNTSRDDEMFPFMRNYDVFAGHGWAGGYADNDGGNNQESAGEALNSWVGAYLYANAVGDEALKKTAMYGFTTELNAIKTYWFNYDGDAFADFYPFGVAGQVYGGSNFFGTFFNGEPLYMYGIHLIPGEEFLTSYALSAHERTKLKAMIEKMKVEQDGWTFGADQQDHREINAWHHIFIPIVASYDPDEAMAWYNERMEEKGSVGNEGEQFNVYWMIHGLKSMGVRSTDIWAEKGLPATVYTKDGKYTALCWNPTRSAVRYTFRNANGVLGSALVPAGGLVTCDPTVATDTFARYVSHTTVTPTDFSYSDGVAVSGESVTFTSGTATYYIACGDVEQYRRIRLSGSLSGARLFIGGREVALHTSGTDLITDPLVVTFKQTVTLQAANGTLTGISFEDVSLQGVDITGATVNVSADNDNAHVKENIVDGDETTRWESPHGDAVQWVEITLPQCIEVWQMRILWEEASAREYKVYFSAELSGDDWVEVFHAEDYPASAQRRPDIVNPTVVMQVRRVRIECLTRTTGYGYSIFETSFFNFG